MGLPRSIVSIAFACNNPNTGLCEGKFSAVHIGDGLLNLDNRFYPPKEPAISFHLQVTETSGFSPKPASGSVKISRRRFPIMGYKYGWGNWCWDLVIVRPDIAVEIIDYLKSLDCFQCESGETSFFEKFNASEPFEWTDEERRALRERGYQRP